MATPAGPVVSRVYVYLDGANFFNSVKHAFGYKFPNCHIANFVSAFVGLQPNRRVDRVGYYIGVPRAEHDADNHNWWNRKLSATGRFGVDVVRRYLKARNLTIQLSGVVFHKSTSVKLIEKGIDLRLGLDLVKHARRQQFDVAMIFSQDGDLAEAVEDAYELAKEQRRHIIIESCFPDSPDVSPYGIHKTTIRKFSRALYDAHIDPVDFRRV